MNAEKKDKSLENLFEKYIEESPSPNRRVLESAEKELAGDFVCTEVTRKKENFLTRLFKSKRKALELFVQELSFCILIYLYLIHLIRSLHFPKLNMYSQYSHNF